MSVNFFKGIIYGYLFVKFKYFFSAILPHFAFESYELHMHMKERHAVL